MNNKNRLDYQAHLSRHDHDISAGYFHTLSTGMIIPQYFHILGPGDSIYYQNHLFARLQNVVTAFRGEIDIHLDSFFVPLQMIYTPFGQIFAQTDDYLTSLYHNLSERAGFPLIPFSDEHAGGAYEYPASSPTGYFSGHIECVGKEYTRLLDAFDMNRFHACKWNVPSEGVEPIDSALCYQPSCSAWVPAAYQAIYQKYYRNDEFERFSIADYNIDQYFNSGWVINDRIMRLRYVQRPSDYFTTSRVSPVASAVNKIGSGAGSNPEIFPTDGGSLSTLLFMTNSFLGTTEDYDGQSRSFNQSHPSSYIYPNTADTSFNSLSTVGTPGDSDSGIALNAANIRALFAVDKFARIWGRADKTYDDQILAHFGIKIPHDVKHDLTHLKHWHVVLQSDPIYGTANIVNSDSELISTIGQVGAQGQCDLNTQQEKFTAPVHGVFMIVAYAVTKPRYFGTFSKLHLLGSRLSFPIPEFDKLGAQPLYSFETDPSILSELDGDNENPLTRIAWQNRYQEFKKKYNRISLTFMYPDIIQDASPSGTHINVFAPWALSRVPFKDLLNGYNVSTLMSGTEFWERPNSLNVVMETPYTGRWSNDYYSNPHRMFETDPIIMDYMCTAKLVSWMSQTGEPDL